MSDTKQLIGSLSNDLFRVASLQQRGSTKAAQKFLEEAKRWAQPLSVLETKKYIKAIAQDVLEFKTSELTLEQAEKYLMFGVLLQNYALHRQ